MKGTNMNREPMHTSRFSWLVLAALCVLAWSLVGCGRGNAETYGLLAESVVRTYLSSEATLLGNDELIDREREMRTVVTITGRIDDLAGDYRGTLLDELERRGLAPAPTMIGLRPPAPPNPGEKLDVACNPSVEGLGR